MSEFFRKPIVKTLMLKGQEGQSIKEIKKTSTSGLVDTYTITLTDGTTSTFTVSNGKGIKSFEKTSTSGLVDTYTITYNDGTKSTFTVTNGANGEQGDGLQNLQVGGRNLWLNSSIFDKEDNAYTVSSNDTDNNTSIFNGITIYSDAKFANGEILTVQAKSDKAWASVHGGSSTNKNRVGFWVFYCETKEKAKNSEYKFAEFLSGDDKSTNFKYTFKHIHPDAPYLVFRFNTYSDGIETFTYKLWGLKLERGNIATDWTPAPEDLLLAPYPVGSIYISTSSTFNPQEAWGGTWRKTADGRCLIGASDKYPLMSTGGEAEHTLTVNEMPAHRHYANRVNWYNDLQTNGISANIVAKSNLKADGPDPYTGYEGNSKAHNNMQPYLAVYIWERIA